MDVSKENRMIQLNELEEVRLNAYENTRIYKDKTKRWHDNHILHWEFHKSQQVLLYNSHLRLFPEKLKSRWSGPFTILEVLPHGIVEILEKFSGRIFKVNGQHLKHYIGGDCERQTSSAYID